jgi:hypothetical protein
VPVFIIVLIFACRWIIAKHTTPFGIPLGERMVLEAGLNGFLSKRLGGKMTQEKVVGTNLCYMLYLISLGCRCESETKEKIMEVGVAMAAADAKAAAGGKEGGRVREIESAAGGKEGGRVSERSKERRQGVNE